MQKYLSRNILKCKEPSRCKSEKDLSLTQTKYTHIHTKKLDILAKYPDILAFTIKNLPYIILTKHIWFS